MARNEQTGKRSLIYSEWHRTLPDMCTATDIDFVEFRKGKIVAFIETKKENCSMPYFQRNIYKTLAKACNVPAYLVNYSESLSYFMVEELWPNPTKPVYMPCAEYTEFLINIGDTCD